MVYLFQEATGSCPANATVNPFFESPAAVSLISHASRERCCGHQKYTVFLLGGQKLATNPRCFDVWVKQRRFCSMNCPRRSADLESQAVEWREHLGQSPDADAREAASSFRGPGFAWEGHDWIPPGIS